MSDIQNPSYLSTVSGYTSAPLVFAFPEHPLVKLYKRQVQTVRDVLEGSECVKAKGQLYLPGLMKQSADAYNAYRSRAMFSNATARIFNTNLGTIVRRSPIIDYDSSMDDYFNKDSSSFYSFSEIKKFTIGELLAVGRVGVFIDVDTTTNMPVPVKFQTEHIINWVKDDQDDIVSLMIAQPFTDTDPETFASTSEMRYFNLFLNSDGVYTVRKMDSKKSAIGPDTTPSVNGKTLKYIPLVVANTFGLDIEPTKSPMIDVSEINLSHYRTSASLETGRHFVGIPQPVITGASIDGELYVGSEEAWVIPSNKAKAYYLEFVGQGLDGLAKALKEKESQMSQFSAQLMDTGSKGSEAEGTVRMRYASDAANLADIVNSADLLLNKVYGVIADWTGVKAPSIELNKDFISDKLSYNDLRELTKSWIDGALSDEDLRYNLERGEMVQVNKKPNLKNTAASTVAESVESSSSTTQPPKEN